MKNLNYLDEYVNQSGVTQALDSNSLVKPYVALLNNTGKIDWNTKTPDYSQMPLTFEFLQDGMFEFKNTIASDKVNHAICFRRVNGIYASDEWINLPSTNNPNVRVRVKAGDVIQFLGNNTYYGLNGNAAAFKTSGTTYNVYGNLLSLYYGENFSGETSFPGTIESTQARTPQFETTGNTVSGIGPVNAENLILPSVLEERCYFNMFQNCKELVSAPALPATTLASSCYANMFKGCTKLRTSPELPATTLTEWCYANMFKGCTSLVNGPSSIGNSATTAVQYSCVSMFEGCSSLVNAPALPATTLEKNCYGGSGAGGVTYGMFHGCTSLVNAPVLPALTLAESCYMEMFKNCTSLSSITCLATDISARDCTFAWLYNVAASGTFTKNASMNNWTTGLYGIPDGWTVVEE